MYSKYKYESVTKQILFKLQNNGPVNIFVAQLKMCNEHTLWAKVVPERDSHFYLESHVNKTGLSPSSHAQIHSSLFSKERTSLKWVCLSWKGLGLELAPLSFMAGKSHWICLLEGLWFGLFSVRNKSWKRCSVCMTAKFGSHSSDTVFWFLLISFVFKTWACFHKVHDISLPGWDPWLSSRSLFDLGQNV